MNSRIIMRHALIWLAAFALLRAAPASAEVVLVEGGVSRAPIVVFEDAPPFIRRAADELAEYIERTSGARPEVVHGRPAPVPESAVWVGYQPVLDALFPEVDFDFQHPEEILIAARARHLVIAGRDRWDPDRLVVEGRNWTIEGKQDEYGTVNAVYTFLHDQLGVRWLWPGETGVDVLSKDTIAFSPFEYRYHPQIRQRASILRFLALSWLGGPCDWTLPQRLQLDSMNAPIQGHGFGDWWDRFNETHRHYFALQPDGTRSGFPSPGNAKLCQSNPAVWQQWIADVEAQIEEDPNQTVFSAAPNDSWLSGHCVCENCQAWDHPDGELRSFRWQGEGAQYVALSDRHVTFANQLGRLLKERFPDRELYVMMYSYGHSRPVPIEAVPDDNVIMCSVANFILRSFKADRGSSQGTLHRDQLAGWGEVSKQLMWRPNTGSPSGWRWGAPVAPFAQMAEDMRLVADAGCIGISIDTVWIHWATQGPLYYLMAHLAWNPYDDEKAIMADYWQRGFGPAADSVEAYFRLVEVNEGLLSEELVAQAAVLLDRAAEEAAGSDKHAARVAFVRAGMEFTRLIVENRALVERYRESGGEDAEARQRALANWDAIGELSREYPGAVNWFRNEPRHGRTAPFHPDGGSATLRLPLRD